MTKTSTFLFLVVLTSAVGCAKTTDLGKMQEETIALVKVYLGELDVLQRRHTDLSGKTANAAATARLTSAGARINHGRTLAASAPTMVATAAKTGNPEELIKVNDETIMQLVRDIEVAKNDLDAFEANMTLQTADATPPPATPPTTPDTPVSNDGAGAGSAKAPAGTPPGHTSGIPCSAEIALQCPEGQIDGCLKQPPLGTTHGCVAK